MYLQLGNARRAQQVILTGNGLSLVTRWQFGGSPRGAATRWELAAEAIAVKIRWFGLLIGYLLANLGVWRKLPADVQDSIQRNAIKYVKLQRADNIALNASLEDALKKRGMMFTTTDTSGFRPPLADFYRRWKEHFGARAWAMLEGHVGKLG